MAHFSIFGCKVAFTMFMLVQKCFSNDLEAGACSGLACQTLIMRDLGVASNFKMVQRVNLPLP